jgi:hypothetical protein
VSGYGSSEGRAGHVYAEFVKKRIEEEERRTSSLQARGLAIVSTSGALVTLLFGIGSITLRSQQYVAPMNVRILLVFGAAVFGLAAVSGLAANIPRSYAIPDVTDLLQRFSDKSWSMERLVAEQEVADSYTRQLHPAERGTINTAFCVKLGVGLEVLAVILVVVAISISILR